MAKNFHILTKRNKNRSLSIRLSGDFDGSSACELINSLNKIAGKSTRVVIDTNGLRTVDTFGLKVLHPQLHTGSNTRPAIEVTGRFRNVFQPE